MGKRIMLLVAGIAMILTFQPVSTAHAETSVPEDTRIAFVRDHNVWLRDANGERRVSHLYALGTPQWSADGKFVAIVGRDQGRRSQLRRGPEFVSLEVINAETAERKLVTRQHTDTHIAVKWAPKGHQLAFQRGKFLSIADFDKSGDVKHSVGKGVTDFAWLPDSSGFLISADAHLLPDGWTQALIYKLSLSHQKTASTAGDSQEAASPPEAWGKKSGPVPEPTVLFRVPKTLGNKGHELPITGVHELKWSKDGQWVAFLAHPTASLAMDEQRLCVLSKNGSKFHVVGPMLGNSDWFKWSPGADTLGFIRGFGRDTTRGKKLSLAAAPAFKIRNLSPMGAVDNGFCWMGATHIIVSRHQEALPSKSPIQLESSLFPALFNIDVERPTIQNRITSPPEGVGDYEPKVLHWQQTVWRRAPGAQQQGEIWFGKADGTEIRLWIENAAAGQFAVYSKHRQQTVVPMR